jgi:DNA/RNA endonuclease YhcR with UshA esterase domain
MRRWTIPLVTPLNSINFLTIYFCGFCLAKKSRKTYQQEMKNSLALLLLSLGVGVIFAQESKTNSPVKIAAAEAKKHVGDEVIVTGNIAEVNKIERLVRLNLDKPFPNQDLTLIIFSDRTNLFPGVDKLQGKKVEVNGKITDYRGRPQIILTNTNQVKALEEAAGATDEQKK